MYACRVYILDSLHPFTRAVPVPHACRLTSSRHCRGSLNQLIPYQSPPPDHIKPGTTANNALYTHARRVILNSAAAAEVVKADQFATTILR